VKPAEDERSARNYRDIGNQYRNISVVAAEMDPACAGREEKRQNAA
jgi:hypothetical protein